MVSDPSVNEPSEMAAVEGPDRFGIVAAYGGWYAIPEKDHVVVLVLMSDDVPSAVPKHNLVHQPHVLTSRDVPNEAANHIGGCGAVERSSFASQHRLLRAIFAIVASPMRWVDSWRPEDERDRADCGSQTLGPEPQ